MLPQPPYMGPSKAIWLTAQAFDEQVLIVPPPFTFNQQDMSHSVNNDHVTTTNKHTFKIQQSGYQQRRQASETYQLVLFHINSSRHSREVELVFSKLSYMYTCSTLKFNIMTPEQSESIFFDQDLIPIPNNSNLPKIKLFFKGKLVQQLPESFKEGKVRKKKMSVQDTIESHSNQLDSDDESEEENWVQEKSWNLKFKWDRSAVSVLFYRSVCYGPANLQ
ncbi:hypothetical protein OIO90_001481 [Microbotryomycetes sp. JL221]|nr:hypothetical protein OIO90_001481 [Microbotryomycetes sp. JL221]